MDVVRFNVAALPPEHRLAAFAAGAKDFQVAAAGDPAHFSTEWHLLKLGDVNAIHSHISPISYRRTRAMIEADGEDRVAVHCYLAGASAGTLDGQPVAVVPGGAMVWDLASPLDVAAETPLEVLIVTLPRHLLTEVLPLASYSCALPPSPELALVTAQIRFMFEHAADLPEDGAAYIGRALRDLVVVAMLPVLGGPDVAEDWVDMPLFRRVCDVIDEDPGRDLTESEVAEQLDVDVDLLLRTADRFGGWPLVVERRRLLSAYRLLCDPSEAAPVSSIAWRCGFDDVSRFHRRFRDVFHASPGRLRQYRYGHLPRWAGAYHIESQYDRLRER